MRWSIWLLAFVLAGCSAQTAEPVDEAPVDVPEDTADDVTPDTPDVPELAYETVANGAAVIVHTASGQTLANAAFYGYDTSVGRGVPALDVPVPPNATGLVLELVWDDEVQDLDAELTAPDACVPTEGGVSFALVYAGQAPSYKMVNPGGSIGAPDGPSRLVLDADALASARCSDEEPPQGGGWGDPNYWTAGFRSKDANAMLAWELYTSVFFDGPVPDGYTAVPA